MDYDIDFFTSYRITDPINFPGKSVFCGYSPSKSEYAVDILGQARNYTVSKVEEGLANNPIFEGILSGILNVLFDFVDLAIGDWLLAGTTSVKGMLMECVQPQFSYAHRSEYFQYWIPYQDTTGYFGTSGEIPLITATLSDDQAACQANWLAQWNTCVCKYDNWAAGNGYSCSSQPTYSYDYLLSQDEASCPYNENSEGCASNQVLPYESNATCTDIYQPLYLGCIDGIHIMLGGVIQ
jgi:hypothetical protein